MTIYKLKDMSGTTMTEVNIDVAKESDVILKVFVGFILQMRKKLKKMDTKLFELTGWTKVIRQNKKYTNEIMLDLFVGVLNELFIQNEKLVDEDKFKLSKQNYLMLLFENLNFTDKKTRQRIRDIINRNLKQSIDEVADEYLKLLELMSLKENASWINCGEFYKKQVRDAREDVAKLKNSEWITCYRGFNTRDNEEVRFSTNKNKSDYYRQREGMGFSYSMDKYVAFQFSGMFHLQYVKNENAKLKGSFSGINMSEDTYLSILAKRKGLDLSALGRMTIGRYVIHKDHILGYNNQAFEREIICDDKNAKLINYTFLSNKELESNTWISQIDFNFANLKRITNNKDLWINKNWKSDVKVGKSLESRF